MIRMMPHRLHVRVEGANGIHVGLDVACHCDGRTEPGALAAVVEVAGDDRHLGAAGDAIETGLPHLGTLPGALGWNDQDERIPPRELLDHLLDEVVRSL